MCFLRVDGFCLLLLSSSNYTQQLDWYDTHTSAIHIYAPMPKIMFPPLLQAKAVETLTLIVNKEKTRYDVLIASHRNFKKIRRTTRGPWKKDSNDIQIQELTTGHHSQHHPRFFGEVENGRCERTRLGSWWQGEMHCWRALRGSGVNGLFLWRLVGCW